MKGDMTVAQIKAGGLTKERFEFLQRQVRANEKTIKRLQAKIGESEEFARETAAAIVAAEPFKPYHVQTASRNLPVVSAAIKLSDWHIGERTLARETEGFGRFNYAIAENRIFTIIGDFLKWVEIQRKAYRIQHCIVFCEGDYISGNIHEELRVTNEFPLPQQTAKAGLLLGEVIRRISGCFETVDVSLVGADNHGRLNPKPQAKQKTTNSMSYLVHMLTIQALVRCQNIRFHEATGMKSLVKVDHFKVLSEHGDTIKGWAGLPYYGFSRMIGKEAKRRMNTSRGFHYWSIDHFHVPCVIEGNILVNGSLSGTSEFDHSQGRHAVPSQVAFLIGQHGVFNWVPFTGKI